MEPHAVPQNVTNFQFKLIGDMTLKQFLYLAVGVGIAYLFFVFATKDYPYIAWPTIVLSSIIGAAFAFLPIQSRPLDVWVAAYFKAIYSPTKLKWKKGGIDYTKDALFRSRYLTYISSLYPTPKPQQTPIYTTPPLVSATQTATLATAGTSPPPVTLPSHQELAQTVELAKQAQNLQMQIIQTERELHQLKARAAEQTPQSPAEISNVLSNLQSLIGQVTEVKHKLEKTGETQPPQIPTEQSQTIFRPTVKVVTAEKPKQTQLALTTFPNVINGIIKDTSGNYLENVVVVIYDKEGLPVRALKTNKLGQFTGSTPLPNSTYKVELEKEGVNFDMLEVELNGQVMAPLLIKAK